MARLGILVLFQTLGIYWCMSCGKLAMVTVLFWAISEALLELALTMAIVPPWGTSHFCIPWPSFFPGLGSPRSLWCEVSEARAFAHLRLGHMPKCFQETQQPVEQSSIDVWSASESRLHITLLLVSAVLQPAKGAHLSFSGP